MKARAAIRWSVCMVRGSGLRGLSLVATIALGVAVVVAIGSLDDALERGLRREARALLGGDLAVESRRPLPDLTPYLPAAQRDARRVGMTILSTMVRTPSGASRLVELKAIDASRGEYPLAGALETAPGRPLAALLDDDGALVAPELCAELGLRVGDVLLVGGVRLTVAGTLLREPDPLAFSFKLGPRVLIRRGALLRTQLLAFGSRVRHRVVFRFDDALSPRALADAQAALRARLPGGDTYVSVETHTEAQPMLRKTLERVRRYVGLVGLACLLMASVGAAQSVSAWLRGSVRQTAILRCLGFRARAIFALHLRQVLALALLASVLGSLVGAAAPWLLSASAVVAPVALASTWPWLPIGEGIAVGVGVSLAFSLLPLLSVWRASPARVLRSAAAPLPLPPLLWRCALAVAAVALWLAGWLQTRDHAITLWFVFAIAALAATCWLAAAGLVRAARGLSAWRLPAWLRHGIAGVARPDAGTHGGIVALGLGTMMVLCVLLLDGLLARAIDAALPATAPSVFLLDVQPDQRARVAAIARSHGAAGVQFVPLVTARLLAVDGRDVASLLRARSADPGVRQREQWMLTREQRISWMARLPPDNRVIAGRPWSAPNVSEVSVEQEFARELGVGLGSVLRFDVQGVAQDLTVTSLRTVNWRSFAPNFFLVAEPGVFEAAPHVLFAALRLPADAEQALQDQLSGALPNVSVLRVRGLLDRARGVLAQLLVGVKLLGGFAVASGLMVLTTAIVATEARRAREAALWKALGLTRRRIAALLAVEYALVGAAAGLIGALAAYVAAFAVARTVLSLDERPSLSVCALAVLATSLLAVLAGLLASARALWVRPSAVLR